jgi:transcriptional regulator with XRE-family HTH domain
MMPSQLRMARAALRLKVRDIEERTGVNKNTVSRYEAGKEIVASALQKLEKMFREEGIVFLDEESSQDESLRLPALEFVRRPMKGADRPISGKRNQKGK